MTEQELRALILEVLAEVAPDADVGRIDPAVSFHEQFGIDSVDYLNLMMTLEARLGVAIPEADCPKLASLDGCVRYLQPKVGEKLEDAEARAP